MVGQAKFALRLGYILFFSALLTVGVWASGSSKTSSTSYNVTSTIYNGDGVNVYLLQGDLSVGDPSGSATYSADDANVIDSVGGQWEQDLLKQTVRQVYLDFSLLTKVTGADWPSGILPAGYYNAALISRCYDASGNGVSLLSIAPGSNNNCMLEIYVVGNDGYDYTLQIGHSASGAPATGTAQVTCNAVAQDGSGCDDWTVAPYLAGTSTDTVANLTKLGSKTSPKSTVIGYYSGDTFRVHITRP